MSFHQHATWGHTEEEIEQKVFQSSWTVLPTQSETTMKVRAKVLHGSLRALWGVCVHGVEVMWDICVGGLNRVT